MNREPDLNRRGLADADQERSRGLRFGGHTHMMHHVVPRVIGALVVRVRLRLDDLLKPRGFLSIGDLAVLFCGGERLIS
jgi:hypothetical protein